MADKHIHIHLTVDASESAKEAAAVLGHFGGMARAAVLAPGRRHQIASKAAKIRWRRKKPLEGKSVEPSNK